MGDLPHQAQNLEFFKFWKMVFVTSIWSLSGVASTNILRIIKFCTECLCSRLQTWPKHDSKTPFFDFRKCRPSNVIGGLNPQPRWGDRTRGFKRGQALRLQGLVAERKKLQAKNSRQEACVGFAVSINKNP